MRDMRIGLIGAGQMATALGHGLAKAGLIASGQLLASDPSAEARDRFARATGAKTTANNLEVAAWADVLWLAVKPQQMREACSALAPHSAQTYALFGFAIKELPARAHGQSAS